MTITHIFFDLHGTVIDGAALHPCYSLQLGRLLTRRFGGTPAAWIDANRRVLADWDSYYADLDLNGDDGMSHLWEGLLRTTRALFRLTDTPLPPPAVLRALAREIPGEVTRHCDAIYPDAREVIQQLCAAGYMLGITSHALTNQARGLLRGGGLQQYFAGPIIGPDEIDHFQKDETFYSLAARRAGVSPRQCLAIDDTADCLVGAKAAGMHTVQLARRGKVYQSPADHLLNNRLDGLVEYVQAC